MVIVNIIDKTLKGITVFVRYGVDDLGTGASEMVEPHDLQNICESSLKVPHFLQYIFYSSLVLLSTRWGAQSSRNTPYISRSKSGFFILRM